MENTTTNLEDLFAQLFLTEEDKEEASQYSFQTEREIDDAIEIIKELNADEDRFKVLYKEKKDKLDYDLECKVSKIEKKKEWILFNLKNSVMAAGDAKETKTMFKKSYLSGDIVIKKSEIKLIKPELTQEQLSTDFKDYAKTETKITLNWAELKKRLKIINGEVLNVETGEILSTIISTEITSESVIVK